MWPPNDGSIANLEHMISYMGLRWVRRTIGPSQPGNWDAKLVAVANDLNAANPNLGFKLDYILNGNAYTTVSLVQEITNIAQKKAAGILKFVEGHNEVDNEPFSWNGVVYGGGAARPAAGSWNGVAAFHAALYAGVRENSTLNGVAVSNAYICRWRMG